jgi:glycosyltransferase involved in cell wall biosynthesis
MFLSCGGYWPNKAMHELVEVFNNAQVPDTTLVLTGYDNRHGLMPNESEFVKPFLIDSRADVMSAIREADLYILHSHSEGFGLVLLESMLNKTQWVARNIAGAETMKDFGMVYDTDEELVNILKTFKSDKELIDKSYEYVTLTRLIRNTVDDILRCV